MRKSIYLFFLLLFVIPAFGQQPKYIFYLIGDGMGINHVNLTETYLAEKNGQIGQVPLVFSTFPFATFASTNSLSHGVTDSAAGGTALAVGKKTKNGNIATDSTGTIPYKSIAIAAKEKGLKVGITTSVSIDHATPASFYANQSSRSKYYEIANDIAKSNFDFFGGSGFLKLDLTYDKKTAPALLPILEKSGYSVMKGNNSYLTFNKKTDKIVFLDNEEKNYECLKFSIDQNENDLKLKHIVTAAIQSLSTDNDKGFFLMVEGGKIDWSSHSNDAATTIHEVLDFNESVKLAYDFYLKHPEETLIVVTADHETGGLAIGNGSSTLNTKLLQYQKVSLNTLSSLIRDLRSSNPNASWEQVKALLTENVGLWKHVKVSQADEKAFLNIYNESFKNHTDLSEKTLYANDDKLAKMAVSILNTASSVAWSSTNHSAAYVPVYAIGAGAKEFNKKMDNTDIPKTIAKVAGLNL